MGTAIDASKLWISIHVPRMEDDTELYNSIKLINISIHVPRVEDDVVRQAGDSRLSHFNPRPPCGGRL